MKRTLLLVTILVSLFAQGMKAQERTAIIDQMKYITIIEQMTRDGVLPKVGYSISFGLFKDASPEFTKYLEGPFVFETAKLSASYYRENCSIDEMRLMSDYMTSPTMQTAFQKIVDNMSCSEDSMVNKWYSIYRTFLYEETPSAVKKLNCSKEYRKALDELFSVMCLDKYAKGCASAYTQLMIKSTTEMFSNLSNQMGADDTEESGVDCTSEITDCYTAMGEYLVENMPTIMRNIFIQNVPLEDVQAAIKIKDRVFYPAMKRATEAWYDDLSNYSQKASDIGSPKLTEIIKSESKKKE